MLKLGFIAALAAGALFVGAAPGPGVAGSVHSHPAGVIPHTSLHALARTSAKPSSVDTAFTCGSASCTGYESAIDQYLTDVAAASGSNNVYSVATQYSDSTGPIAYSSTFGGAYVDTTPYPANLCSDATKGVQDSVCLTDAELQTEIAHAISVNGWPTDSTRPSHLYAIFTPSDVGICFEVGTSSSNHCSTNTFCAYHDDFSPAPNEIVAYAVEPEDGSMPVSGCDSGNSPNGTGADATINTLSHETNEAITDPWPEASPAWLTTNGGDEIGDLCAWVFGSALGSTANGNYNQVINGHDYWLQEEYSNAGQGCAPYLGGPVSKVSSGTPPLVDQGGPVMRTNTVYAIYWVPTTRAQVPSSTVSPFVSGTAAVGKTLSTTNGTWLGTPTSYAYQWLRCNSDGANCTAIPGAQSVKYTVAKADIGHALMSQVTAKNAAGSVPTTSLPTNPVVGVPRSVRKPRIGGSPKVGKQLREMSDRWSGLPTRFSYEWLRCSAKGTSCARIRGARTFTYRLTAKDASHRLRVQVTAANAAGKSTSTSSASAVVKP